MKKKITYGLIGLVVLIGLGFWGFDSLGGNNPILIQEVKKSPPTLIGLSYEGTPQDERLRETFDRVQAILSTQPGKKLHTIYEVEPGGKLDTMRVFIGMQGIRVDSLDFRDFSQKGYLIASVEANRWVMPGPLKVQERLREYAQANEMKLSNIFIDKILTENKVQIIAPLEGF